MLTVSDTPKRRPDVIVHQEGDTFLLARVGIEGAFLLNNTSRIVWDLLDGTHTLNDIVDLLSSAFEIDRATMLNDVFQVVGEFSKAELIEL